ncbi:hypothetical protein GE09DRAFT_484635 [Coniochaeta sp. 2T2.1]|nr:hypothetical protein GE09DRAFT_484635 [Coniochaeta sp. 2T2.1]
MAQSDRPPQEPASPSSAEYGNSSHSIWRRLFGRDGTASGMPESPPKEQGSQSDDESRPGVIRRVSRKVVPGLPRAQTFKRQQSEVRNKLEPVQPTPAERRAVSVDRRLQTPLNGSQTHSNPRSSAPDITPRSSGTIPFVPSISSIPVSSTDEERAESTGDMMRCLDAQDFHGGLPNGDGHNYFSDAVSTHSMTKSQYDALIHEELERTWILNLSMQFRDKSKREKFFVTYRERPTLWRRVTISVDYRNAPENSLELELAHIKYQRDKIAKIYDAIRESLIDIQFYPTVTNLKLQTTEGRLHVHVVEDVNEIIHYPSIRTIQHMRCNRVKERDIDFDAHISGFVYKVRVNDEVLIKKEIPGPDTVDEFLYEINALNRLRHSSNVIRFYGVIVDDNEEYVKGLLISHAEQGALVDIIYDQIHPLPWSTRERWARQIVSGLSEIHEAGFVQGDFTLSNIVIDDADNAKIIDINRRGCPVGWEPPEATPLIESNQRISMYIGVKSDLFQLGMVLWALAMKEDEPEAHGRPLRITSDVLDVPDWFRRVVDICLSDDPRGRMPALQLLSLFPDPVPYSDADALHDRPSISVELDDGTTRQEYFVDPEPNPNGYPRVRTVQPASDWSYVGWGHSYVNSPNGANDEPFFYPTRGRSPPSPLPSNPGEYDSSKYGYRTSAWASTSRSERTAASEADGEVCETTQEGKNSVTPRRSQLSLNGAEYSGEAEKQQDPTPTQSITPKQDVGVAADVTGVDETSITPQKSEEPHAPRETETSSRPNQDQNAEPQITSKLKGHTQESVKGKEGEQSFVEPMTLQQMQGEADRRPAMGHTEPDMAEKRSEHLSSHAKAEDIPQGPEDDLPNKHTIEPDVSSLVRHDELVETAPGMVALPSSGQPTDESGDTLQAVAQDNTYGDHSRNISTIANTTTLEANPESSTTTSMCDVPDDLKGVGSTYKTGPENWHQSMTDHDIADLIDAEMAADTNNDDGITDTTVTNHTDI